MDNEEFHKIAEGCGLYIATENAAVTAKEIEFFAEKLIEQAAALIDQWPDSGKQTTFGLRLKAHFGIK